jgi:sugar phosphate isomerase/epimerase
MELGLSIELRATDKFARRLATIAGLGYQGLHVHFPDGCDKKLARTLAGVCAANGLSLLAVSGYANPLRPDEAPMGMTVAALERLIDLLPLCGARAVVSWSGTYSHDPFVSHAENQSAQAWEQVYLYLERVLPLLDAAEGVLLLEAHRHHVLADAHLINRLFMEFSSPYLGLVFDPANLANLNPTTIAEYMPHTRLVHLRDTLSHEAIVMTLRALDQDGVAAPLVIEQVSIQQARTARAAVIEALAG